MSCNISEYIDELENENDEINIINMKIKEITEEYRRNVDELKDKLTCRSKCFQTLKNKVVSIRLGDLIDELSWLSGINVDDIIIDMKFNVRFLDLEDFLNFKDMLCNRDIRHVRLSIYSRDSVEYNRFNYFMFLSMDINSIQNDGKRLIDHCVVSLEPFSVDDSLDATFKVENNISDVMCDFNLGNIPQNTNSSWYPCDLFSQAIFECVKRDYDENVDKIRKKIKY